MTGHPSNETTTWGELPTVITAYLTAHRAKDVGAVTDAFSPEAIVVDEGNTYRGRQEIARWVESAGTQYTYTTEFTAATTTGADSVDVLQHLEGDFPGGVVDLHYRFTLDGGLIGRLVIEP
ncbi:nuclear transport factor 2 family protein [Mycolicibacterium sp. CBMA 226]|uniref:nuclear transport factor 2 family protein n=1 Tax=Mycolicibacterium sp. CBMA 226 TaxID=2606611 RepID=UPI0012DE6ED2|nr:nuclear transport factor 2 family protein [Mycolicibacterium sp. CBMA 226]MUL78481.1 nuclear transport factor 2 family protein [Mycolicibacterium sp. CBMA 226]